MKSTKHSCLSLLARFQKRHIVSGSNFVALLYCASLSLRLQSVLMITELLQTGHARCCSCEDDNTRGEAVVLSCLG